MEGNKETSNLVKNYNATWSKESKDANRIQEAGIKMFKVKHYTIHSFSDLSDDRSKAASKTMPPHSAI